MKFDLSEIKVLSTMEAIRKRPTMYVGDLKDPKLFTRLIIEALCLSRARAKDGCVSKIDISVKDDNSVLILDNGPGMPMESHGYVGNITLLEKLLTQLHACKNIKHESVQDFCDNGIVVVNALCESFIVTNMLNNLGYLYVYRCGESSIPPYLAYQVASDGLKFDFQFDASIFGSLKIDKEHLIAEIEKIKLSTPAKINLTFGN